VCWRCDMISRHLRTGSSGRHWSRDRKILTKQPQFPIAQIFAGARLTPHELGVTVRMIAEERRSDVQV
jgi:hypothetical protein